MLCIFHEHITPPTQGRLAYRARVFATGGDLEEKSFLKKETTKRDWRSVRGCKSERMLNEATQTLTLYT